MKITVTTSDFIEVCTDNADTIVFDPPYDAGFYGSIPMKQCGNKNLVVWTSSRYIDKAMAGAVNKGWVYRWLCVWDCVSSWYIPKSPLLRDNIAMIFGDVGYNSKMAIIQDGNLRKSRVVSNPRGEYVSVAKDWANLATVYSYMRSRMKKTAPHEKPVVLMRAILGALNARIVVDLFCGSGAIGEAAMCAQCSEYRGSDIDEECVRITRERLANRPREIKIGELFENKT